MSWIVVLTICSAIDFKCLQPIEFSDTIYGSWQECSLAGYRLTHNVIIQYPESFVEANKLMGQFSCEQIKET